MNNEIAQSSKPEGIVSGLVAIFLFGGFAVSVLMLTLLAITNIVWANLIHHSSGDTHFSLIANIFILLFSLIFYSFQFEGYALVTAAVVAVIGYSRFKKLPIWYLLVMLPLCAVAMCIQTRQSGYLWSEIDLSQIVECCIPILFCYLFARRWLGRKQLAQATETK